MATKKDYNAAIQRNKRRPYWLAILIAIDQQINALFWGFPDETISSRAYRCANLDPKPKTRWIILEKAINGIFFWDKEANRHHCQLAYEGELQGRDFPIVRR